MSIFWSIFTKITIFSAKFYENMRLFLVENSENGAPLLAKERSGGRSAPDYSKRSRSGSALQKYRSD